MEAIEVRVDDPIVKGEWMFTLRLNEQRQIIVEVRQINVSSWEFAMTDTAVLAGDQSVLSALTKRGDRAYLLHTPGNLIEAAQQPVHAAA